MAEPKPLSRAAEIGAQVRPGRGCRPLPPGTRRLTASWGGHACAQGAPARLRLRAAVIFTARRPFGVIYKRRNHVRHGTEGHISDARGHGCTRLDAHRKTVHDAKLKRNTLFLDFFTIQFHSKNTPQMHNKQKKKRCKFKFKGPIRAGLRAWERPRSERQRAAALLRKLLPCPWRRSLCRCARQSCPREPSSSSRRPARSLSTPAPADTASQPPWAQPAHWGLAQPRPLAAQK